jgi:hypothetical protein
MRRRRRRRRRRRSRRRTRRMQNLYIRYANRSSKSVGFLLRRISLLNLRE